MAGQRFCAGVRAEARVEAAATSVAEIRAAAAATPGVAWDASHCPTDPKLTLSACYPTPGELDGLGRSRSPAGQSAAGHWQRLAPP